MGHNSPLGLFAGFGIEIEYMIVNRDTLDIMPIADKLLANKDEVIADELCYSNELALHLIELKTNGPAASFKYLPRIFNQHIKNLNKKLAESNACLLSTAMHPWMQPEQEFKIWPHSCSNIYKTYDAIFNCQGHGWSNVQSTHLNLPFANDEQFAKLHTAIRLLLPIIPMLAASSPIVELKSSGYLDTRLFYYNQNQREIPIIAGAIIPDHFSSQQQYKTELLHNMYQAIAPHDEKNILQEEWLNSRGAIARFDRNTIEIRLLDSQEAPLADLAIIALLAAALQNIVNENWSSYSKQAELSTQLLKNIYLSAIKYGFDYVITEPEYLKNFACDKDQCSGKELWNTIFANIKKSQYSIDQIFIPSITTILTQGNLAERILRSLEGNFTRQNIAETYRQLARCLANNDIFAIEV